MPAATALLPEETATRCAFGGGAVPILGRDANSGRLEMSPSTRG